MSLASRCPACQTVFRVVQDQLRVSEGWVRCGRCAEVFNATEHMVDVAKPPVAPVPVEAAAALPVPQVPPGTPDLSDAPSAAAEVERWAPDEPHGPGEPHASAQPHASAESYPPEAAHKPVEPWHPPAAVPVPEDMSVPVDARVSGGDHDGYTETPGADPAATPARDDLLDLRPGSAAEHRRRLAMDPVTATAADASVSGEGAADARHEAADMPSFLRDAQRAERWQRPAVRSSLAVLLVLGLFVLAGQVVWTYRDLIAARWPASRIALEPLCRALDCRIDEPRWLEAIVVESTGLTRVEGTNNYRLQVMLRNRSAMVLALPSIDLTLTDNQGRLVARRALSARDLGARAPALAAQGELPLQATLAIGDKSAVAVSGYTIEIFYP